MNDYTIVSSRVRLARNFADVPFPSRASDADAAYVAKAVLAAAKSVREGKFYAMEGLDKREKAYLVERHLISPALASAPYGAAFLSKDKRLSVMIMEEDHVRAQSFASGLALKACFDEVKEYDLALRAKAPLAYDKKLGYLTACPTNVGTGMRASVMMFLPGITMQGGIEELEEELKEANLTIRGALGEGSKGEGYCYQISNGVSLGVSEETILNRVTSAAEMILEIEGKMLERCYSEDKLALEDAVFRALAILGAARTLSQKELEYYMVYLKIGVSLGLIAPLHVDPDELLVMCKPYGIIQLTHCDDTPVGRDVARAEFIRNIIHAKEG
ncbi:MAG: ATP--guanido phosphotransferase [Clostridia bacterium]|nr:ATP--guanido phosphotransferase [Clostridia bacterium]